MTKQEKNTVAYFNLNAKDFMSKYAILLDEDFFKGTNEIYAEGLTRDEAEYGLQMLLNDSEIIENNIKVTIRGMHSLYLLMYIQEQKRLNRVKCISSLRKVISLGTIAKRLYKRNYKMYGNDIDKFIADYNF